MKKTYQRRQIVTRLSTGEIVTRYRCRCKFTGELFYSENRRAIYAPGSLELKRKQREEERAIARNVCPVYFPRCIITGEYFTSRTPGARCSPEGQAALHERQLEYARQHRQRPAVKEREKQRRMTPARREYFRQYMANQRKGEGGIKEVQTIADH